MTPMLLRPGLWWWTASHPSWTPDQGGQGGWEREVGSAAFAPPDPLAPLILLDPLIPPGTGSSATAGQDEELLAWLDPLAQGRKVVVLLANRHHGRSTGAIAARHAGTSVLAAPGVAGNASAAVDRTFRAGEALPGGVRPFIVEGTDEGEVAYLLPAVGAVFVADALIGTGGGGARLAPAAWSPDPPSYEPRIRASLRPLLDQTFDVLLTSHGPPVLSGGRDALERALAAPPLPNRAATADKPSS